jgi:hypothetical protein
MRELLLAIGVILKGACKRVRLAYSWLSHFFRTKNTSYNERAVMGRAPRASCNDGPTVGLTRSFFFARKTPIIMKEQLCGVVVDRCLV